MKAFASYWFAAFQGFSVWAAEPRFTTEMTPYRSDYHFYNPAGEIVTQGVIWDGQTTRPAELSRANDKGDGFINVVTGEVLNLGTEHSIYRAKISVNGVTSMIEPFG